MMIAPICLFTYNRPKETKQTLEALEKNYLANQSELFIFSDKDKYLDQKVKEVRAYIKNIKGFKSIEIIESSENKGLANSIISGVNEIVLKYKNVIVLEDDLVTTPNFLNYMNQALDFYKEQKKVQSINAFSPEINTPKANTKKKNVHFQYRPFPWGWGTWSDRWDLKLFNKEELKGKISRDKLLLKKFKRYCGDDAVKEFLDSINYKKDTWYINWVFNHFENKNVSVYPFNSFVDNIGFNLNATHCKGINTYKYQMIGDVKKKNFEFDIFQGIDKKTERPFLKYFKKSYKIIYRIKLLIFGMEGKKILKELKLRLYR